MSASGLIYAAIAILWAAVLIPMWLRNHESATENRSAERFGQAMRVLSRKEGEPADDLEAEDRRTADHAEARAEHLRRPDAVRDRVERPAPTKRRTPSAGPAQRLRAGVQARRAQRKAGPPLTLVQRRARTLGVLVVLTVASALLSLVTPVPRWTVVPFALLAVTFVVHLRIQARQKLQPRRVRTSTEQRRTSADDTAASSQRDASADRWTVSAGSGATAAVQSSDESGVVQGPSRAVVVERKGEGAGAHQDASDPEAWRPNPLPLPTYVTAPKAVRPIKVIDLTTPGAWTSGRLLEDDVADEDLLAAQVADEELDALIGEEASATVPSVSAETPDADGRRAVGD